MYNIYKYLTLAYRTYKRKDFDIVTKLKKYDTRDLSEKNFNPIKHCMIFWFMKHEIWTSIHETTKGTKIFV